jgi:hypothetical protein
VDGGALVRSSLEAYVAARAARGEALDVRLDGRIRREDGAVEPERR